MTDIPGCSEWVYIGRKDGEDTHRPCHNRAIVKRPGLSGDRFFCHAHDPEARARRAKKPAGLILSPGELRVLRAVLDTLFAQGACWQSIASGLDRDDRNALPGVMDSIRQKLDKPEPPRINR